MSEEEIPKKFLCPISNMLMKDPVLALDGHTYEREQIEEWYERCSGALRSPLTNDIVPSSMLIPNKTVKSMISEFTQKNPDVLKETYLPESFLRDFTKSIIQGDVQKIKDLFYKDKRLIDLNVKIFQEQTAFDICCRQKKKESFRAVVELMSESLLKTVKTIVEERFVKYCTEIYQNLGSEEMKWLVLHKLKFSNEICKKTFLDELKNPGNPEVLIHVVDGQTLESNEIIQFRLHMIKMVVDNQKQTIEDLNQENQTQKQDIQALKDEMEQKIREIETAHEKKLNVMKDELLKEIGKLHMIIKNNEKKIDDNEKFVKEEQKKREIEEEKERVRIERTKTFSVQNTSPECSTLVSMNLEHEDKYI